MKEVRKEMIKEDGKGNSRKGRTKSKGRWSSSSLPFSILDRSSKSLISVNKFSLQLRMIYKGNVIRKGKEK